MPQDNAVNPDYYKRLIKGVSIDLYDIEQAWDLGRRESDVLEYVIRARFKENQLQDLKKAKCSLERAIQEQEEKERLSRMLDRTRIVRHHCCQE